MKIRVCLLGGALALVVSAGAPVANASSHREAPFIAEDPVADNTDLYAFVDPLDANKVVLIANWIPFEAPQAGPSYRFGEGVLYDINIDNDGDAKPEIVFRFTFRTDVDDDGTTLHNTGPIGSLDDPDWNVRQTYTVERRDVGRGTVLARRLLSPPANLGPRSTPDYASLAQGAVHTLSDGIEVFAGQRDDPFFGDVGALNDLLGLRPLNPLHAIPLAAESGVDGLAGFNVHTIAMRVPRSELVNQFNDDPVIGVWSWTHRPRLRKLQLGGKRPRTELPHLRVSRLGMPLVNALFIPLGEKDRFNTSRPQEDAQFDEHFENPEPAALLQILYTGSPDGAFPPPGSPDGAFPPGSPDGGFVCFPGTPREDIVSFFLTGVSGLNQPARVKPAEMLRLNTAIPPTPLGSRDRLGGLAGQQDGFPNGRRLEDDVVDIELRMLAGATPLGICDGVSPNQDLTDGVDANDVPFLADFPYVAPPHPGYAPGGAAP